MVKVLWVESARDDLKEIYDYISSDSIQYAKYQINQIRNRASKLKENPYAGKVVEDYNSEFIREIIYSHYRIIYRVKNKGIIHIYSFITEQGDFLEFQNKEKTTVHVQCLIFLFKKL